MRVDPNYLSRLSYEIDQSTSLESSLTTELSSGLHVSSLQIDPGAAARSALFGSAIARDDQYVQAASGKQAMLQVADTTLGEVVKQLTTAITLGVQGSNGTLNAANLASTANQLSSIRDQVLSLANANYLGSYLFGGSSGATAPYSLNTATTPATAVYAGDNKLQYIETPNGQRIQTNLPGSTIFANALSALNQAIADLSGGASGATIAADVTAMTAGLNQVSMQRSILNSSLSRVLSTSTYVQTDRSQLSAAQTTLVAADMASVATQLKSAETQHQALLSVVAALGSSNLFNYLK